MLNKKDNSTHKTNDKQIKEHSVNKFSEHTTKSNQQLQSKLNDKSTSQKDINYAMKHTVTQNKTHIQNENMMEQKNNIKYAQNIQNSQIINKQKSNTKQLKNIQNGIDLIQSRLNNVNNSINSRHSQPYTSQNRLKQLQMHQPHSITSDYLLVLQKYRSLGENPKKKGTNKQFQQPHIQSKPNSRDKEQHKDSPVSLTHKMKYEKQAENKIINPTEVRDSTQGITQKKYGNTRIRFLAQKQHQVNNINLMRQGGQQLNTAQNVSKLLLTSQLKKTASLPSIRVQKDQKSKNKRERHGQQYSEGFANKQSSRQRLQSNQRKRLTSNQKIEKKEQLIKMAFMLSNLKQKIKEGQGRSILGTSSSRIRDDEPKSLFQNSKNSSFYSQFKPDKLKNPKMPALVELSRQSPSAIAKDKTNNVKNIQNQEKQLSGCQANQQFSIKEPIQHKNKNNYQQHNGKQFHKLSSRAEDLELIKEDIQNQNNQKQELLKNHYTENKNLQISVIQKRQRIASLESELDRYNIQNEQQSGTGTDAKNIQFQPSFLQQEKTKKAQAYKIEKQKLRLQMNQIQNKIKQQQGKFASLRQYQLQQKDQELKQKQIEIDSKNKLQTAQLETKTKQLEAQIKREQQKSQVYKKQLEEQSRKNAQVLIQLKKQDQLQQMLLKQIQKIAKQKVEKKEKRKQEKNKQRLKLLQQIKALEQTQMMILMQYQRDTQAANSIFQAMRLKNIQLQDQIKNKKFRKIHNQ